MVEYSDYCLGMSVADYRKFEKYIQEVIEEHPELNPNFHGQEIAIAAVEKVLDHGNDVIEYLALHLNYDDPKIIEKYMQMDLEYMINEPLLESCQLENGVKAIIDEQFADKNEWGYNSDYGMDGYYDEDMKTDEYSRYDDPRLELLNAVANTLTDASGYENVRIDDLEFYYYGAAHNIDETIEEIKAVLASKN